MMLTNYDDLESEIRVFRARRCTFKIVHKALIIVNTFYY
jgi:hypothetical protein